MSKTRKPPNVRYNEQDIMQALSKRYAEPEWAFFPQVRNSTGVTYAPRTADAVALNLWPSRGMELHGFEIKTSRSDFLNELKLPEKSDSIAKYCDRWWLVTSNPEIVQRGELPAAWGLLVMHGTALKCEEEAKKLEALPLDRTFVASLLRNQAYCPSKAENERYSDGVEYGKRWAGGELKRLKEEVDKFETVSGIKIRDSWSLGNVALAVKALTSMEYDLKHIAGAAISARRIADTLQGMVDSSGLKALADDLKEES